MVEGVPQGRSSREGTLLGGKYLLEKRLGAGGMGEVWRARNVALERPVAIKVLRSEHAEDANVAARFLREARTASLVRHRNVVDVLDVGQDDAGAPFLVQELLDGEDLASHVAGRGGKLTVDEAIQVLLPVVDAVAFAHAKGVVHRDLKPENVFLARDNGAVVPKLLDFGISHVASGPRITATGVALGTPAYMAPEQIKGTKTVDARSDVWAIGIMLHELLAGALPFRGESTAEMFVQIATAPPIPLRQIAPHVPPSVGRVVARCLRRAPEERYADARELLVDLRAAAGAGPSSGTRPLDLALVAPPPPMRPRAPSDRELAMTEPVVAPSPARSRPDPLELALPADAAPLQLAPAPTPRPVARGWSSRPAAGDFDGRRLVAMLVVAVVALVGAGALTLLDAWPDAAVTAVAGAIASLSSGILGLAGLAVVALGVVAGVRGWRLAPKSWAHLFAAVGFAGIGAVLALAGPRAEALPWAVMVACLGTMALAVRQATDACLRQLWSSVAFLVVGAALLLFVVVHLARAAAEAAGAVG